MFCCRATRRERRRQAGWTEAARAQVDTLPKVLENRVDPDLEAQMLQIWRLSSRRMSPQGTTDDSLP